MMEPTLIALASELTGLQAAAKCIADRIEQIQAALAGQQAPVPAQQPQAAPDPPAQVAEKSAPAPMSDAKRLALEKARRTLAERRAREAAGVKVGIKKAPAKGPAKVGIKAGAKVGKKNAAASKDKVMTAAG
jgi:hypothetical protein